jgi:hypothetical protein
MSVEDSARAKRAEPQLDRGSVTAMPERRKPVARRAEPEPPEELRRALTRQKKTELVDLLMELARGDRGILRQLTARLAVTTTVEQLVVATRQAIADATDFDERDINRNFDYDCEAYNEVERNLKRLIESGHLRLAMELALELMKDGSHQVEMSDEGLMTADIEACLHVVISAFEKYELPGDEVVAWCAAMLHNDRVGFIAHTSLESLRDRMRNRAER